MKLDKTLEFLAALEANNSLDWMKEHRDEYQEAKNEFLRFLQDLIDHIAKFDPSVANLDPKRLIYRLNRDTRFSHDKSPYNPAFRAHISIGERKPVPAGYYISIRPGKSFLGGGIFASQFPEATTLVRDRILTHGKEFQKIITDKSFTDNFEVTGQKLKNVPRGYDKDHPLGEYLKHKAWAIEYAISDTELLTKDLTFAAEKFRLMQPLNSFLNDALLGFKMPER